MSDPPPGGPPRPTIPPLVGRALSGGRAGTSARGNSGVASAARAGVPPSAAVAAAPPSAATLAAGTGVFAADADEQRAGAAPPPPPPRPQAPLPPTSAFARPGPAASASHPPPSTPSLPALAASHPGLLIVSRRQAGNPLLAHLPPGRWVWGPADAPADYYPAPDIAVLFLSLRFHLLKPDYILARIRALAGPGREAGGGGASVTLGSAPLPSPRLRVLLVQVDVDDPGPPLESVNVLALRAGLTLICATGATGAARFLDLYRSLAGAPPTAIAGRADASAGAVLGAALTGIRGVNATDVLTLGATFKTAGGIFSAPPSALASVPGIGPTKARRLAEAFHTPFRGKPVRQTRLDAVFGRAAARAAPPAGAPPPPPPPGDAAEPEPPPPAPQSEAAWAPGLEVFEYDDLDDADLVGGDLGGGAGGGSGGEDG